MASAERGEFDLVLVEDLDRLSRNASDTHSIIEELERLKHQGLRTVVWRFALPGRSRLPRRGGDPRQAPARRQDQPRPRAPPGGA